MTAKNIARLVVISLVAAITSATVSVSPSVAATGSDFDPGYIISDDLFFNGTAMTANEIQNFLELKVPHCTNGYTCLKDFTQTTKSISGDSYCKGYAGAANETAAKIMAKVAVSCNISPKVLLVLLQKEQGLVTHVWPSDWRYDKATGYACPDTASCNSAYQGFFKQVYYAARQYQVYAGNPTRYNYRSGRNNNILFHPKSSCGSSPVYIVNQATAGLYNYTPYQPNSAALANLYGTGNSCSSYGNRNFWRLWTDWFGSTISDAVMARTRDNARVYLISGTTKYPVTTMDEYRALLPMGGLAYVSQSYLDGFDTGQEVGANFRSPGGTIAMLSRGTLFPYKNCTTMTDLGYGCDPTYWIQLTDAQFAAYPLGNVITNLVGTSAGGRFLAKSGVLHEILDVASQEAAGIIGKPTVIDEAMISHLDIGSPYIRSDVYVTESNGSKAYIITGDSKTQVDSTVKPFLGLDTRSAGSMLKASLGKIPNSGATFNGVISTPDGIEVLAADGRYEVAGGGFSPSGAWPDFPDALLETYPVQGKIAVGSLLKAPPAPEVYLVTDSNIRHLTSWGALLSVVPGGAISITNVSSSMVSQFATGEPVVTVGSLVRTRDNPNIYLIDGIDTRIHVPSFALTSAAGFKGWSYVKNSALAGYATSDDTLSYFYRCDGTLYVAASGALHSVPSSYESLYPGDGALELSPLTCSVASKGSAASRFVRTSNGKIYLISDGSLHHVETWSTWLDIHGSEGWTSIDQGLFSLFTVGSPV